MEKTWQVVLLLSSVILVTLALLGAHAQESDCSRPRVSVSGTVVDEADFQEYLKGQYPHRSWESLWQEIRATVLEELRENSPQIDFVEDGSGCDYSFSYTLGLIAAGFLEVSLEFLLCGMTLMSFAPSSGISTGTVLWRPAFWSTKEPTGSLRGDR
jgi:hypothetical protein